MARSLGQLANRPSRPRSQSRDITNRILMTGAIDFNNLIGFVNEPRGYGVQFKARF